jgi:sirohydrochlorin cobaltochelatase
VTIAGEGRVLPAVTVWVLEQEAAQTTSMKGTDAFDRLNQRLQAILPPEYQDSYESLQPVPMGSAGLKYDNDGRVAWDEIWGTFCDLAMAGGPPHKGALLEPASSTEVDAAPDRYAAVTEEICRGIILATKLDARGSVVPGWIRVGCYSEAMAAWLLRAIVMENVAARCEGRRLDVPAGPDFRLEKEIKSVVTVVVKTSHYWLGHIPPSQRQAIAELFLAMEAESPLLEPARAINGGAHDAQAALRARIGAAVERETGLPPSPHRHDGWLGFECPSVHAAVWMMRAMVASNVLSRREATVLFVPIDPARDPDGERVAACVASIHGLAVQKRLL